MPEPRPNAWIAVWGVAGVVALFGRAIFRLGKLALEPILGGTLSGAQVAILSLWVVFSLYAEGYRAFQLRFCPRVVARALHLGRHPRPAWVILAPLFSMGFFHANRKTLVVAWGTVAMIAFFIVGLRHVPQPWRGIVDAGVVAALGYGVVMLLVLLARGLRHGVIEASPELPESR